MADGGNNGEILRIGPLEPPAAPGRGVRYCAEASLVVVVMGIACIFLGFRGNVPEFLVFSIACVPLALVLAVLGRRRGGEAKVVANFAISLTIAQMYLLCTVSSSGHSSAGRRAQFTNNMKQVGLALHNYHAAYGRLPPAAVRDQQGRPLYSWRVLILPYMEAESLYREFHLDEPRDSPHNRTLLSKGPMSYSSLGMDSNRELTYIQAFVGPGSAFESPEGEPFASFSDGLSNTILAVEAREGVPWSAPYDLPSGPDLPPPALGGGFRRERELFEFEAKIKGCNVLMADGSVKWLKLPVSPVVLRALITRNGGDVVPQNLFD